MISDRMKGMLDNPDYTEAIARCWPIIEDILMEQNRISVSEEDPCPKEFKGQTVAYRALEKFKSKGEASIEAKKKA